MAATEPCLCVDLDGTLIRGDTFRMSLARLGRRKPWLLPIVALTALRGRASAKGFVARFIVPNPAELHWRNQVLDFVASERARGRRVVLVTAAHKAVAEVIARHLGLFDEVVASDGTSNVKARHKLIEIRKMIGDNEFDYIGDSRADLVVFRAARHSYLVSPSPWLLEQARRSARVARVFDAG